MTTGVPFFDIYLKSLTHSPTITTQNVNSPSIQPNTTDKFTRDVSMHPNPSGYKFTRHIANSLRPSSQSIALATISNDANSRFLRLPTEIWLLILLHLPLSQITELNLVCRRLFCIVRFKSGFWFHVQKAMAPDLPDPIPLVDGATPFDNLSKIEWTAYTNVKENFGSVCDYCYRGIHSTAEKHGSSAVLPLIPTYNITPSDNNTNNNNTYTPKQCIYLCLPCRRRHYLAHPESAPSLADNEMTFPYDRAICKYRIPNTPDLRQPRIREIDAAMIGRRLHGGDIGIWAERLRIANGEGAEGTANLPRTHM